MAKLPNSINELIENFSYLDDWESRYQYLMELGRLLPEFPEDQKTEANKVNGCVSQVWMIHSIDHKEDQPYFYFKAESDAHIVKGLIALLYVAYNDLPLSQVSQVDIKSIFSKIGLENNLLPNRRNGFFSMVGKIQALAS